MLNQQRIRSYLRIDSDEQDNAEGVLLDQWIRVTSRQRHRIRQKEHSRKTHGHEKGLRCALCRPARQERLPGWRKPERELKF